MEDSREQEGRVGSTAGDNQMIYLDNPATSWPKPPCMLAAMAEYSNRTGGNPGRSGHRMSTEAGRIVFNARDSIAALFESADADRVVFTLNATMALNIVMLSLLRPGDVALTTSCEHNSVMRPLRHLQDLGVRVLTARASVNGSIDMDDFEAKAREHPRLVIAAHASNVTGYVIPVEEMGRIAKDNGAFFLLDAAQTAGTVDMEDVARMVDVIAFSGHKGLLGPQGTGGAFICSDEVSKELKPIIYGGTGSRSAMESQPEELPDKLEAGTLNGIGIAGLGASVRWLADQGIGEISRKLDMLTCQLIRGLRGIEGITVYGPNEREPGSHLVSLNLDRMSPSDLGRKLDEDYGILGRIGLHCSPSSHKVLGTFPEGSLRLGPGPFNTPSEIEQTIEAITEIAEDAK